MRSSVIARVTVRSANVIFQGVEGELVERRQIHNPPPQRLMVQEHQAEQVRCPSCQQLARGTFPTVVNAPAQYGPGARALDVYLHDYQLPPVERTCKVLADVWGCPVAEGTLLSWGQEAATKVEPTVQHIADYVAASPSSTLTRPACDWKGSCIGSMSIVLASWRISLGIRSVGEELETIGIWPRFAGCAIHDRWMSYDTYPCQHSVCAAHLCRELTFLDDLSIPITNNQAERDFTRGQGAAEDCWDFPQWCWTHDILSAPHLSVHLAEVRGIPLSTRCSLSLLASCFPSLGGSETTTSPDTSPIRTCERGGCAPHLARIFALDGTNRAGRALRRAEGTGGVHQ